MKYFLFIIAWILWIPIDSLAQICTVRPDNNAVFNWRQNPYNFYYTAGAAPTPVDNPFVSNSNVLNISKFRSQGIKDYDPLDGWNLIQYDFGKDVAGKTIDIPWIVLYNKYESILRVFMWIPSAKTKNGAKIDIKFKNPPPSQSGVESALLSHASSPAFAIDNFEKRRNMASPNATNSNGQFWMYADFLVAYDPCTCNQFTTLLVTGSEINVSELKFSAGGQETTIVANGGAVPSNPGFSIDGFIKNIASVSSKGNTYGKSIGDAVTIINDVSKNFDKKTTVSVPNNAGSQTVRTESAKVTSTGFRLPSWIKDASSGIGLALGLLDLFMGGGKQEPSMAITLANAKFRGTITDSAGMRTFEIYTPGSKWRDNTTAAANTASQPYYDNVLGVFALLNTPTVKFKRSNTTVTVPQYSYLIYPDQPNGGTFNSTTAYTDQLNLKIDGIDGIDYAINPASNLEVVDIKGSLIINATGRVLNKEAYYTGFNGGYQTNNAIPTPSQRPGTGTFAYLGYSGVNVFEEKTTNQYNNHNYIIQTPPMSLDCIKNYVAKIGFVGGIFANTNDIRLQIMLTLKRKDNPNAKEVMFVNQYKVNLVQDNILTQSTDLTEIPIVASVENLVLTQDRTIRAWDSIAVKGNINTNGFKLRVISGGQLTVEDQSVFNNPDIEMSIGTPEQCIGVRQPVDFTQLTSFCNSKYNPVAPASLTSDYPTAKQENISYNLWISPNPFNNQFAVNFTISEETKVDFQLSNAVGQMIKTVNLGIKDKGNYQETIEVNNLPPGIYFLTLRTQYGTETKKIVKQK